MREHRLPPGLTPRMLCREAAAEYCGISGTHFDTHVDVPPVEIGRRKVWDIRSLDRWLDQRSGLVEPLRQIDVWLGELGACDRAHPRR